MKNQQVKRMTGIALLMAMVVVLQFVSSAIPPVFGMVSISLALIPVVLGAAVFGPSAGCILGATLGVVVTINSITGTDPGGHMVFEADPILCILVVLAKSTLAGLTSGWVYKLLKKWNGYIAMLLSAIVCPVVNTGVFLASMALLFTDVLSTWAGGGDVLAYVLSALVLCNFVPELAINMAFSPAGEMILKQVGKGH